MRSSINLLVSIEGASTLQTGAQVFFAAAGLEDFEERWSDNHSGGAYYLKRTDGVTYRLMAADNSNHPDRPFWVRIELEDDHPHEFDLDRFVRDKLLVNGFQVSNMIRYGRVGEERHDF